MLVDMKIPATNDQVFQEMEKSPIEFALTGSRYMECHKPTSDWDFITNDKTDTLIFLKSIGFSDNILPPGSSQTAQSAISQLMGGFNYSRPGAQTNAVVQYADSTTGLIVQVQLCKSARIQKNVRDIIFKYLPVSHKYAQKYERAPIWDMLAEAMMWSIPKPK